LDERAAIIQAEAGPSSQEVFSTASGFSLDPGEGIEVRASGSVSGDANLDITSGPAGRTPKPALPLVLDSAPHLALLARVGGGPWVLIGAGKTLSATSTGEIVFAINDVRDGFQNNTGAFQVSLGKDYNSDPDDPDTDGDGFKDGQDGAPTDPAEHLDTDGDMLGNNVDPDDDNDGLYDSEETGATFTVLPPGASGPVPVTATGLHLAAGEFPVVSATGTMTDGANLESSTPEGRADLNTHGAVLTRIGTPLYQLLGRIGQGEWFSMGASEKVGYATEVLLSEDTHHLGDQLAPFWEAPVPEGTRLNRNFEVPFIPLSDAVLRLDVWSTRTDNRVSINGSIFGRLCQNLTESFVECEIPIPLSVFRPGTNTLQISAGLDDDTVDTTSFLDDFQVRNIRISYRPSSWRVIETAPHHLGDQTVPSFEVSSPEGTSAEFYFTLTHLPATGTARLFVDSYSVRWTRGQAMPVFINGTQVGALCPSFRNGDFWEPCAIDFDVDVLVAGSNQVEIRSVSHPYTQDYDDFMVRFIQLKIPEEGSVDELYLSYNERIGQFADNTGAYQARTGKGILTDPLDPDSDGDGIEDGAEESAGTDPNDPADPPAMDLTLDGVFDHSDVFEMILTWQRAAASQGAPSRMDSDKSGWIDATDLVEFLSAYW
jgi:hypothetical protein